MDNEAEVAPEPGLGGEGDTVGLLDLDDDILEGPRTYGDWFVSLHPMARWLIVFIGVGGLAGALVGLLLRFGGGADQPPLETKPVVIATWFAGAAQTAFNLTAAGYTALDAVEAGCTYCEVNQCDGTVGWGGSPDTLGETTLDAIIMDGELHDVGAVTDLRRIREAISVARRVLHYTKHTMLAGEGATAFAISQGFEERPLNSTSSTQAYADWRANNCVPNYFAHANNLDTCGTGPTAGVYDWIATATYTPMPSITPLPSFGRSSEDASVRRRRSRASTSSSGASISSSGADAPPLHKQPRSGSTLINEHNHDTVAMCVLDLAGHISGGGSSNGATHKVAGRSSDIAMVGAGLYVDRQGGCAAATGDGDITSRFLPAMAAVEAMRGGNDPQAACEHAVRRIMVYHDVFGIGLICMDRFGNVGAAAHGLNFSYAIASSDGYTATLVPVPNLT